MPANWPHAVPPLGPADVKAAVERVAPHVRPVALLAADTGPFDRAGLYLAAESAQITGSFKVREAVNFAVYYLEQRSMPEAGVVIADPRGGNAAYACAWAARETETAATVFAGPGVARGAVDGLCALGAQVQVIEGDDAAVAEAARRFADREGALLSHPYDNPLVVAGAGTLAAEINAAVGSEIDTVVVPVVGAALFAGTCAALEHTGIRIVPVELHGRRRLAHALETAVCPTDGGVESCGVTPMAVDLARGMDCVPVAVTAEEVDRTRAVLWQQRRLAVEWPAAMALAAVQAGVYVPDMYERVVVVLTGGNIDPSDLIEI
ncbi:MAG TPA: pyridoxal-phosphate dependent enzyme [Actinocrinis sp.]|jgi:threonine dehydratase|uniref:pyridoxal-phosphate dependent enzyme n=1 Tax=Actinocrinis sp. TaxID=1920516 RepID=UPI002DDCCB89|nr:pyridoxal-phosphate dependent enzyme [Actinocrinis sp.]HEV3172078.1 pyridoxal-phosphate dependent enzyme [Actinocrinis sp.]